MHEKRYTETSLECYEVMRIAYGPEALKNFMLLSAFKYLWRYKNKGGAEDLKKARDYLDTIREYGLMDEFDDTYLRLFETVNTHALRLLDDERFSNNPYQE